MEHWPPDPAAFQQNSSPAGYTVPPSTYMQNFEVVRQTIPELKGGFKNLENGAPAPFYWNF